MSLRHPVVTVDRMPITIANMTHLYVYHNCSHDDAGTLLQQCACTRATIYVYMYIYIPIYMRRHKRSSRAICMHTCYQYIRMCIYIYQYICNDTGALPEQYACVRATNTYVCVCIQIYQYICDDTGAPTHILHQTTPFLHQKRPI